MVIVTRYYRDYWRLMLISQTIFDVEVTIFRELNDEGFVRFIFETEISSSTAEERSTGNVCTLTQLLVLCTHEHSLNLFSQPFLCCVF